MAGCYRRSLTLARENGVRTIAFPAISTGAYGYPAEAAAEVAVNTVREFPRETGSDLDVTFCCFSKADLAVYERWLATDG